MGHKNRRGAISYINKLFGDGQQNLLAGAGNGGLFSRSVTFTNNGIFRVYRVENGGADENGEKESDKIHAYAK